MLRFSRRLLFLVLGVLVAVLAVIGGATVLREARPAVVRAFGDPEGTPAAADAEFARTVALLTRTPLLPGNAVAVLLDGDGTFPPLWRDLRAARRSLTVQLYYISPGLLLDSLVTVLSDRGRAGVRTHFLYDAVGATVPDSVLAALRAAHVRVAAFRPVRWYTLRKAQNRSHARVVVIDGLRGYTGGFGIDDRWRGSGAAPQEWRETNVRIQGPAVAHLQAAFATAWSEATAELLTGELYFPAAAHRSVPGGAVTAGVMHAQPTPGATAAERLFALSVAAARERLYITSAYFVPGAEVIAQLAAAARRGVDVRLLLPGAHTDVPITRWAARGAYERLLRNGVRIYEYQPGMVHAKSAVVDGVWSAIGSMNLDNRSFVHNEEVVLLAWDQALGASLEASFRADLGRAREITLPRFRERPWRERLRERLGRQLTRIL